MQSPQVEGDSSKKAPHSPAWPVWLWEREGAPRVWGPRDPEDPQHTPWPTASAPDYVQTVRAPMTMIGHMDLHGDPNGLDAQTPLSELTGTITPGALHFVSPHGNGPPDIDPREHRLLIYGMVDRPLVFTMDELMRLPSVSRIHYIECIANSPRPRQKTLDEMHGMVACSEWTGVPLSLLLNQAGVRDGVSWLLSEGAEATTLGSTMPMAKAMDDVLVACGQNGEPLRPHNGYPLRLVTPGFQGKYHVKWLRRIKAVDRPYPGSTFKGPQCSMQVKPPEVRLSAAHGHGRARSYC